MTATHKSIDYFLVTDCRKKKRNIFQEKILFFLKEGRRSRIESGQNITPAAIIIIIKGQVSTCSGTSDEGTTIKANDFSRSAQVSKSGQTCYNCHPWHLSLRFFFFFYLLQFYFFLCSSELWLLMPCRDVPSAHLSWNNKKKLKNICRVSHTHSFAAT